MKLVIGSDHGGFSLKQDLVSFLHDLGHSFEDVGVFDEQSADYPDLGILVARKVADGDVKGGILICGTGVGMSIVANKFSGVRAALVNSIFAARMAKEHNDANVLVLGGRIVGVAFAREMVKVWLETTFQEGRHKLRLRKIEDIERRNFRS
jgi:ribose 5-phosphate isomerase B